MVDGKYHVYFNGRDRDPNQGGKTSVGLAQTHDWSNWKIHKEPVFSDGHYAALGSCLLIAPSTYVMYYSPDTRLGFRRAVSRDGVNWRPDDELLLSPAAFGCSRIGLPFVTSDGDGWLMLFEGITESGFRIFYARSEDGHEWSPGNDAQPIVFSPSEKDWDHGGQANPSLFRCNDERRDRSALLYNGHAHDKPHAWDLGCARLADQSERLEATRGDRFLTREECGIPGGRLEGARLVKINTGFELLFFKLPTTNSYKGGQIIVAAAAISE